MAQSGGRTGSAIRLEDWVLLNQELAALVRAGLPLELGLRSLSGDARGRLRRACAGISARLERGEPIEDALAPGDGRHSMGRACRALLSAGQRSGQMGAAIESVVSLGQVMLDVRRSVSLALVYPAMLVVMAYGLLVGMVVLLVPRFIAAFDSLRLDQGLFLRTLEQLGRTASYWAPIGLGVMVLLLVCWVVSGSVMLGGGRWTAGNPLMWLPRTRRILRDSRSAIWAELLASLVRQGVPLEEALPASAEVLATDRQRAAVASLAEDLRQGGSQAHKQRQLQDAGLSRLVVWTLAHGRDQGHLLQGLEHARDTLRRRVAYESELVRLYTPMAATLLVGSMVVLGYGLCVFLPLRSMLKQLTQAF